MSAKRATELIPKIKTASTNEEAIAVLHDVLTSLYLTNNYTNLIALKDRLAVEKNRFREITDEYEFSEKTMQDMTETRGKLNFLYRDVSDELSFDINRSKIYFEEYKTSVRAESMKVLKEDKEIQEMFGAKSTSALRDIVGIAGSYKEYISNASVSYGLYQELNNILNSIRMFIDLLSGSIKNEQIILMKDAK